MSLHIFQPYLECQKCILLRLGLFKGQDFVFRYTEEYEFNLLKFDMYIVNIKQFCFSFTCGQCQEFCHKTVETVQSSIKTVRILFILDSLMLIIMSIVISITMQSASDSQLTALPVLSVYGQMSSDGDADCSKWECQVIGDWSY